MARLIDLIGKRFGKLEVICRTKDETRNMGGWLCLCLCGNTTITQGSHLRNGHRTSCGCSRQPNPHYKTPTYNSWDNMLGRCHKTYHEDYHLYGGRGIKVCDRWKLPRGEGFRNFLADMGERPEGTTLDRKDRNGNYSPENCEWQTGSNQSYWQRKRVTNTSGRTGVSLDKISGKWEAYITVNYKTIRLGKFGSFADAVAARREAELKYYGRTKD